MMTTNGSDPADFAPPRRRLPESDSAVALTWALLAGLVAFVIGVLLTIVVVM